MGIDFLWKSANRRSWWLANRIYTIGAAFLGTLVTPYHLGLWQTVIKDLSGSKIWTGIAEWTPIAKYFPTNALFALSGLIFIYMLLTKFKKVEPVWFLVGAGIFCSAFLVNNLSFFWVAIFIFVTARNFDFKLNIMSDFWAKLPIVISTSAVFLALILNLTANIIESASLEVRLKLDNYPVQAMNFIKQKGFTHGLFNEYAWGGFIDWQFSGVKVFIDGRMTGWRNANGRYILADYLSIWKGECESLRNYDVKVVLIKKNQKNVCFEAFEKVYEDSIAKVLVRSQ
ncbi:hypothetical protein A2165_00490 [Candidatus Curtissbacteria bacterium RBG_13_40_7]|uniref:Glycosyltransferase RgtA/B/C/D-like domain-containing protein n=1 Tax=Candidatus Curtissbacteria bacterium RBG_13_40_7 TaxID=1797706 RepID=A0A1F5FVS3_9BACT|nr:MAG: hypothetical protein A2165_00490 [Candidatus Curtissbacteria bacterium RBG_13_40_7]